MKRYVDKSAIVAEIERRKRKLLDHIICERDKEWVVRTAHQLNRIIMFIDTLEVKEVDLEKELIEWHKEHFKKEGTFIGMSGFYLTNNSQMDIAKHFFELGLKTKYSAKQRKKQITMKELDKLKSKCVQAMKDVDTFVAENYDELIAEMKIQRNIPDTWKIKIVSNCGVVHGCYRQSDKDEWFRVIYNNGFWLDNNFL